MQIEKKPRRLLKTSFWIYLAFLGLFFPLLWVIRPRVPHGEEVEIVRFPHSTEALLYASIPLEEYLDPVDLATFKTFNQGKAHFYWFKLRKKEESKDDQQVYRIQLTNTSQLTEQDSLSGFLYLQKRLGKSLGAYLLQ